MLALTGYNAQPSNTLSVTLAEKMSCLQIA